MGKKTILFVDDESIRVTNLSRILREDPAFRDCILVWEDNPAKVTVDDLNAADVVMLDHDMCQGFGGPCPNPRPYSHCGCQTGRDVLERMLVNKVNVPVIIHSANVVAARRMAVELQARGIGSRHFSSVHSVLNWNSPCITDSLRLALDI